MAPADIGQAIQEGLQGLEEFQIAATYAKLFPLMRNDFRALGDCVAIHGVGNMVVTGQAGPFPLAGGMVSTHITANPSSETYHPVADSKLAEYQGKIKAGETAVSGIEKIV